MDILLDLLVKINIPTTKGNIYDLCLVIIIIFVTITLFVSSYDLSFALNENEIKDNSQDNKKDITSITTNKTKEILNVELNSYVQDDIENSLYPNQFYTCGYPQQLTTDYNSLAQFNCQ
jgi:uncharacterized protein YpmS